MTEELKLIIEGWRKKGVHIADEEAEYLLRYCKRKMEVAKVQNPEEYLPLLYEDEVKNYLYRQSVNATTMLMAMKEEGICVQCV